MTCEKYKSRIADAAAALENVAPGFSPASAIADPELAAHLKNCPDCRVAFEKHVALFSSIDRGLAAMVDGKPSGDFAAHVRQRIAQDGITTRPWFAGWLPVSATALALVVLVTFLMLRREGVPPDRAKETPPAQTARPPREPQLAQKAPEISVPSNASGPRMIRPPRPGQMATNREPEVLVPRGQMAAIMQIYNSVWSGKADGSALVAQAEPATESLKPLLKEEFKIAPLTIDRLSEEGQPNGSSEKR